MRGSDDGFEDTIEYGSDKPPMSTGVRLAALAGVCLVGGFLAGDRADIFGDDRESTAAPHAHAIAVGAIAKSYNADTGFDFELPVLNTGEEQMEVEDVDLVGLESRVTTTHTPEKVPPGEWRVLELQAPADCSTPPPHDISAVRLRVERPSGTGDTEVRLPYNGAAVMLDYQRVVCTRSAPVDRGDVAGVWALQTAYGPETDLEGTLLMRFTPEGTYVWDFEGTLFWDFEGSPFSGNQAAWGTYRIRGRQLVFMPEGGLCRPRDISTWRATVDDQAGVLTMVGQRGSRCPDGEGVWIARRILLDDRLPAGPFSPTEEPAHQGATRGAEH